MKMKFPAPPKTTNAAIDRAGKVLLKTKSSSREYDEALLIVNAWRVGHAYPINTFITTLRRKTLRIKGSIVAQRLKRLPTIIQKLRRNPSMSLSRMQDIGGTRAILPDIKSVYAIRDQYLLNESFSHEPLKPKDYIKYPKDDGYRGIHLIYRYNNTQARNGKANAYKGLKVEIQIRTILQHAWATAVETIGTLRNESLKSQIGDEKWLKFFVLASAAMAHLEKTPPPKAYSHLSMSETLKQLQRIDAEIGALEKMTGLSVATQTIHSNKIIGHYQLIILDINTHLLSVRPFKTKDLNAAIKEYEEIEKRIISGEKLDAVLVSTGKLSQLKDAYPNYFLDIQNFATIIGIMIEENTNTGV
jgi:putative GTP pyrophosphokinase